MENLRDPLIGGRKKKIIKTTSSSFSYWVGYSTLSDGQSDRHQKND